MTMTTYDLLVLALVYTGIAGAKKYLLSTLQLRMTSSMFIHFKLHVFKNL